MESKTAKNSQNDQKDSKPNDIKITEFKIPKFDNIPVSTKTSIVMTNLTFDIDKLYELLPVTKYIVIPKKRGRKKKVNLENPNRDISDGSIITIEYKNFLKGVRLKKKKKSAAKKGEDYFRNSITIVMVLGGKNINFKISRNGKFQMTGCKKDSHAEECVKYIWEYVKKLDGTYIKGKGPLEALFIPAMRNIDFALGFHIDREQLDRYIHSETKYNSIFETSIGYTGVNIKIPFDRPITQLNLKKLTWDNKTNNWGDETRIPFTDYLDMLDEKDKNKKLAKRRYHTFLVFQSGKTIMSSLCEEFAKPVYYEFMNMIKDNAKQFEERLLPID